MAKFEKVSRFKDIDLQMPVRATVESAGYDLAVAEDTVIPPFEFFVEKMRDLVFQKDEDKDFYGFVKPFSLEEIAQITKELKIKLPLVTTGMKCRLESNQYLELSVRSSTPLKHYLILANGVGIIDTDYYDNPDNEGEIFFQFINLSPFAIELHKGDIVGQGIVKTYNITDDDKTNEKKTRTGGFGSTSES